MIRGQDCSQDNTYESRVLYQVVHPQDNFWVLYQVVHPESDTSSDLHSPSYPHSQEQRVLYHDVHPHVRTPVDSRALYQVAHPGPPALSDGSR
eukprot:158278-Karenia_brevis.AAC.1